MRIVALSKDMIAWFHQDLSLHRGDSQADLCMLDQVLGSEGFIWLAIDFSIKVIWLKYVYLVDSMKYKS